MPIYQNILVTVDHSEQNQTVIQKAISLAIQFQATLSLLHVLDNIAMPDTAYGTRISLDKPTDYEQLEAEKSRLQQLAGAAGIEHNRSWLIWGRPEQEIVYLAEQERIDLIVMGFHTKNRLSLLFGSTANGVLHHAPCDLLAVHLRSV